MATAASGGEPNAAGNSLRRHPHRMNSIRERGYPGIRERARVDLKRARQQRELQQGRQKEQRQDQLAPVRREKQQQQQQRRYQQHHQQLGQPG